MTAIKLRPATLKDLDLLKYWDKKPHVIDCSGDDDVYDWEYELPRQVSWREFLIAELSGRPLGMIQIIDPLEEETHYWGDCEPNLRAIDIWIGEEADLGLGYGTEMMKLALGRCFADPKVTAVLIDPLESNVQAIRFYKRLGFEVIEKRCFGSDSCLVMSLQREGR